MYLCWMSLISSLGQLLAGCKTAVYDSLTLHRLMGNCKLLSCSILKQIGTCTGTVIKFPHNCIGQIVREEQFDAVLRIRDSLVRIQIRIRGSVPLTNRSVFCLLLLKLHLHNFQRKKGLGKEVTKQQKSRLFLLFLLDDRRIRIRTLYLWIRTRSTALMLHCEISVYACLQERGL